MTGIGGRVGVFLAACLMLAACGANDSNRSKAAQTPQRLVKATPVLLSSKADPAATELALTVEGESCGDDVNITRLDHAEVKETDSEVVVTAFTWIDNPLSPEELCSGVGLVLPVPVQLNAPLGDRALLDGSCTPPVLVRVLSEPRGNCQPPSPPPAPSTSASTSTSTSPAPAKGQTVGRWQAIDAGPLATRSEPKAVWTGKEVVVIGGLLTDQYQALADGAAFDPDSGKWRRIKDRPAPGRVLTAVWTGQEVVTFGSDGIDLYKLTTGFAYNPATDQWRPVPLPPSTNRPHEAVWTGKRLLAWQPGGASPGALYDPATDQWEPIPANTVPGTLSVGNATWTGTQLGVAGSVSPAAGGPAEPRLFFFDPDRSTWRVGRPLPGPVSMWPLVQLNWTGREVIVTSSGGAANQGATTYAYDPAADRWRTIGNPDVSIAPGYQRGVLLDGDRMAARVGNMDHPIQLLDPKSGRWSVSGRPPGAVPTSDAAFVSLGSSIFHWGIATDGYVVLPRSPNAAWLWKP